MSFGTDDSHFVFQIFIHPGIIDHPYDAEFKYNQHRSLEILKELGFGQGTLWKTGSAWKWKSY